MCHNTKQTRSNNNAIHNVQQQQPIPSLCTLKPSMHYYITQTNLVNGEESSEKISGSEVLASSEEF
jgi:hypothetical protein